MSDVLTRRAWLTLSLTGALTLARTRADAALRIPSGGALRLPLPAPRRATHPAGATDHADTFALALTHESLVALLPDGSFAHPLLVAPPVIDRANPLTATLTLRPGMTFSNGTPVTAAAVVESWRGARTSALGRLALSRLDTMNPFEARGPTELGVRLAVAGTLDEALAAWPLGLSAPGAAHAGTGPFLARGNDTSTLVRNPRCPTGEPFLERVSLEAPQARNEELRAFTTGALDASWWGNSLYEVSRPAVVVRGTASVVVGLVAAPGSPLATASAARSLERALAPLSTGDGAALGAFGFTPELAPGAAPDLPALLRSLSGRALRVAREPNDGFLSAIAERAVALLDAAQIPVMLVAPGEAADASLRAVAPLGADPAVALASLLAAAAAAGGDEAGASAIVRTAGAARAAVAAGVWGRGAVAVLGRASPTLHLRAGVQGARFDGAGRVALADAWISP
jgi:hypothetical protein